MCNDRFECRGTYVRTYSCALIALNTGWTTSSNCAALGSQAPDLDGTYRITVVSTSPFFVLGAAHTLAVYVQWCAPALQVFRGIVREHRHLRMLSTSHLREVTRTTYVRMPEHAWCVRGWSGRPTWRPRVPRANGHGEDRFEGLLWLQAKRRGATSKYVM